MFLYVNYLCLLLLLFGTAFGLDENLDGSPVFDPHVSHSFNVLDGLTSSDMGTNKQNSDENIPTVSIFSPGRKFDSDSVGTNDQNSNENAATVSFSRGTEFERDSMGTNILNINRNTPTASILPSTKSDIDTMVTNILSSNEYTQTVSILPTTKSDSATINHQRRPPLTTQVKIPSTTPYTLHELDYKVDNSLPRRNLEIISNNERSEIVEDQTGKPLEGKVEFSEFKDLLPVITLVEKLQSQVIDLQRSHHKDKIERGQIKKQLSNQEVKIRQITNDIFYLRRMTSKTQNQILRMSDALETQQKKHMELVDKEEEFKVRLDDFKYMEMNISEMVTDLQESFQNFSVESAVVSEQVENLQKDMKMISNENINQSLILQHMEEVFNESVAGVSPESNKESLNNDINPQKEEFLIDMPTKDNNNKLKNSMPESFGTSGDSILEKSTNSGTFLQQLSNINSLGLKNTEETDKFKISNQELLNLYKKYVNLNENFKSMFKYNELKKKEEHFRNLLLNLTDRIESVEKFTAASPEHLSNNQSSQINRSHLRNMVWNNTHKLTEIKKLLLENRNYNEIEPKQFKDQIFAINKSIDELKNHLHHARNKAERKLNEKLKTVNKEMQAAQYKLTALESQVLNKSLASCEKKNKDLQQNLKIYDMDKDLRKLQGIVTSQKEQTKRLEYRVYQLHYWNRNQSEIINTLKEQSQAVYNNIPVIEHVEEELMNFRLHLPADCSNIRETNYYFSSVQVIYPRGSSGSVQVMCEADEDGLWTVIQKRFNGSVDFNRSWEEYKHGFGSTEGEYWLGNEYIHLLTSKEPYTLKIEMVDIDKNLWVAVYEDFSISSESSGYSLNIGSFSGNATNSLQYANHSPFSTIDEDNDASSTHCAVHYTAGWWYKHCHYGNLNGRYSVGIVWFNHEVDDWIQMESSIMKIKRTSELGEKHH
ncbi:protein scabrous-like [Argonauta hians]